MVARRSLNQQREHNIEQRHECCYLDLDVKQYFPIPQTHVALLYWFEFFQIDRWILRWGSSEFFDGFGTLCVPLWNALETLVLALESSLESGSVRVFSLKISPKKSCAAGWRAPDNRLHQRLFECLNLVIELAFGKPLVVFSGGHQSFSVSMKSILKVSNG